MPFMCNQKIFARKMSALFVITIVLSAALRATAAPKLVPFVSSQRYPFRQGYPIPPGSRLGYQAHSLLTVPQTRVRNGIPFEANIRLYNDGAMNSFYNVTWQRLIALPGRLALYDSQRHYLCDLVEFVSGSRRGTGPEDWTTLYTHGYADATFSVSIPYPVYTPAPKGIYYHQVIYLPTAFMPPPARHKAIVYDDKEVFRSNFVKITVMQ